MAAVFSYLRSELDKTASQQVRVLQIRSVLLPLAQGKVLGTEFHLLQTMTTLCQEGSGASGSKKKKQIIKLPTIWNCFLLGIFLVTIDVCLFSITPKKFF